MAASAVSDVAVKVQFAIVKIAGNRMINPYAIGFVRLKKDTNINLHDSKTLYATFSLSEREIQSDFYFFFHPTYGRDIN